jgi:hypothetical protein
VSIVTTLTRFQRIVTTIFVIALGISFTAVVLLTCASGLAHAAPAFPVAVEEALSVCERRRPIDLTDGRLSPREESSLRRCLTQELRPFMHATSPLVEARIRALKVELAKERR